MSKHETKMICPNCDCTYAEHVHCSNAGCTFVVTACPKCDPKPAVDAFVANHEATCEHAALTAQHAHSLYVVATAA